MFCFYHHYDFPHVTSDCYFCLENYPQAEYPAVYNLRAPGSIMAPGAVQIHSGAGSSN
jgi:hypothetical protein